MSERMTDERLAEIEMHHYSECLPDEYESCELLQALKAERAEVARLTQLCSTEFDEMGDEQYSEWVNEAGKQKIKDLMKELADAHGVAQACEARAEAAESKLRAVGELPRYVIESANNWTTCAYADADGKWIRADELDALLKSTDEPRTRPIQGGYLEKDTTTGEVHEPTTERDWTSDAWSK